MSTTSPAAPGRGGTAVGPGGRTWTGALRKVLEWTLGIVGAVAVFLGAFVQFAGEDQSIGFFGVWSARVGDVSEASKFALLADGSLLLALSFALVALRRRRGAPRTNAGVFAILTAVGLAGALIFGVLWLLEV